MQHAITEFLENNDNGNTNKSMVSRKAVNRGRSLALNIINKNENKLVKHLTQKARRK